MRVSKKPGQRTGSKTGAGEQVYEQACAKMLRDIVAEYSVRHEDATHAERAETSRRVAKTKRRPDLRQREIDRLSEAVDCLSLLVLGSYCRGTTVPSSVDEPRSLTAEESGTAVCDEVQIPEFHSDEEFEAWWDALPKVKAEVDPRLLEKVKTSIRLSRKVIDGYNYLAKQMGLRSGQTLMKIVLGNYLADHLPPGT